MTVQTETIKRVEGNPVCTACGTRQSSVLDQNGKAVCYQCCSNRGPLRTVPRVHRNDPCPCGSTRKFKKCCGGTLNLTT